VRNLQARVPREGGQAFPQDPLKQLELSINAVFGSWNSERARKYLAINKVSGLLGTAVNICSMVYGNMGKTSGTGVAFTRDGATGEDKPMGEYLIDAQGEDVVAGIRTPKHLDEMASESEPSWKDADKQLRAIMHKLERRYKYPQDVEFTVQEGKLWMLQTRNAKRTGLAGVRWAVEMATGKDFYTGKKQDKILSPAQAINTVSGGDLEQLLFPIFNPKSEVVADKLTTGLPAGPGAAVGKIIFHAHEAEAAVKADKKAQVILVRHETSPEDVGGMWAAQGILTSTGGMTSHAAVVARGWGKCCIAGAGTLQIDYVSKTVTCGSTVLREGDWISLNGSTGIVYKGQIPTEASPVVAAIVTGSKEAAEACDLQDVQADLGLGRPVPQDQGAHQCRHAQGRGDRHPLRRRGHRAVPHRAHVLRGRPHLGQARVHPGRHQGVAREGAREAAALTSAATSKASLRP
jgi:pyruvate,orthophosphate dikinase